MLCVSSTSSCSLARDKEARRNSVDHAAMLAWIHTTKNKKKKDDEKRIRPQRLQRPRCLARPPLGSKLRGANVRPGTHHPDLRGGGIGYGQSPAPSFAKRIKEMFQNNPLANQRPVSPFCPLRPPHASASKPCPAEPVTKKIGWSRYILMDAQYGVHGTATSRVAALIVIDPPRSLTRAAGQPLNHFYKVHAGYFWAVGAVGRQALASRSFRGAQQN